MRSSRRCSSASSIFAITEHAINNPPLIDLHSHSTASDGSHSPTELLALAAEAGITTLALSDHDTVAGVEEATLAAKGHGIELIPAVEMSVDTEGDDMHLLGYGVDYRHEELLAVLSRLVEGRHERNWKIIAKLKAMDMEIEYDDVLAISKDGVPGRAHVAEAMVRKGLVDSFAEAFKQYLRRGKPAYADRFRYHIEDAVRLIHRTGGVAVWAHPGLHRARLDEMLGHLPKWVAAGLDGIETDYFEHTIEERDRLRKVALEHGLIYTGGSDFHGMTKHKNPLGAGSAGEPVDSKCLEMLKERLAERSSQ